MVQYLHHTTPFPSSYFHLVYLSRKKIILENLFYSHHNQDNFSWYGSLIVRSYNRRSPHWWYSLLPRLFYSWHHRIAGEFYFQQPLQHPLHEKNSHILQFRLIFADNDLPFRPDNETYQPPFSTKMRHMESSFHSLYNKHPHFERFHILQFDHHSQRCPIDFWLSPVPQYRSFRLHLTHPAQTSLSRILQAKKRS